MENSPFITLAAMRIPWQLFVMAAFGIGMVAGIAFLVIGPIAAIRALGLIAMACATGGVLLVGLTLRLEEGKGMQGHCRDVLSTFREIRNACCYIQRKEPA